MYPISRHLENAIAGLYHQYVYEPGIPLTFSMLSLFFKRKDYKEVTVKYLDKITNDLDKLQYKRIAGMTAAQEFTNRNSGVGGCTENQEEDSSTSIDFVDDLVKKEILRDQQSPRSIYNHNAKIPLLSTEFHDFKTASSTLTSGIKTSDSYDGEVSNVTRKSRTLSRKFLAESIDNIHKDLSELRSRVLYVTHGDDIKTLHASIDIMENNMSSLKSMIALLISDCRKKEAEYDDATIRMQEEIKDINNQISIIAAAAAKKEWRFMSCGNPDSTKHSYDASRIAMSGGGQGNDDRNTFQKCDDFCGQVGYPTTYNEFRKYFSFIKCVSNFD